MPTGKEAEEEYEEGRERADVLKQEAQRQCLVFINRVSVALNSARDLKSILQIVTEELGRVIGVTQCVVAVFDERQENLTVIAEHLPPGTIPVLGMKIPVENKALAERILSIGEPLAITDLEHDPLLAGMREALIRRGTRSLLLVPLRVREEAMSFVALETAVTPRPFTVKDIELARTVANLMAGALERVPLYEESRRRLEELMLLSEISHLVTSTLDYKEVLARIMQGVYRVLGLESCSLLLMDEESDALIFRASVGDSEEARRAIGLKVPVEESIAGRALQEERIILVSDVRQETYFYRGIDDATDFTTRSVLGVPLLTKEGAIGVIEAVNKPDGFSAGDIRLVESVAASATVAIQNARLHEDLRIQLEELKRTQAQLIQAAKLAAIGELTAGVAHELNNPLTAVLGFASLLLKQTADDDPAKKDLTTIVSEAARARDIVGRLMGFARQAKPCRQRTDLSLTVRETLDLIRQHLEKQGIVLEESYAPDLPWLRLDISNMKQVIFNLVTNAYQAMPHGGKLSVSTTRQGEGVAVCIADTGVGIPPEYLDRIFDPFFTTRPVGQGTGLGLSVSLGIVQSHGGSIEVESTAGQGSVFTIWLPIEGVEEDD